MILQVAFTKFWVLHTEWDFILLPIYLTMFISWGYFVQKKNRKDKPEYQYFLPGLIFRFVGVLYFTYIYTFHYYGGDTTNYFESAQCVVRLLFKDFWSALSIISGNLSPENFSKFNSQTAWPLYYFKPNSFAVVRFSTIFVYLGCFSYYTSSLVVATFTYSGLWKLYQVFVNEYPKYTKQLAIAILFMPSVAFWGSGISKDSFMLAALGWFVYGFYSIVKKGGLGIFKNIALMILGIYIMICIKAFNFYVMAMCIGLWFSFEFIGKIKNNVLRVMLYPIIFSIVSVAGMFAFLYVSSLAGDTYSSVDGMLEHAVVVQQDLTRDAYGENSFDIGPFEPTLAGISSKIPQATIAGLFRPFPWEARNILMVISAAENVFLFFLTIFVLFSIGPLFFFRSFTRKPYILMLSLVFSLFFAFSVGLVTANFGALVRYKIPLIPFYVAAMFMLYYSFKEKMERKRNETV